MTTTAARARGGPAASDTHGPLIRAARATHAPLLTPCPGVRGGARTFLVKRVRRWPLLPPWVPPGVLVAAAAAGRLRLLMDAVRLVGGMFSLAPSG
jgi:hypothetical protein